MDDVGFGWVWASLERTNGRTNGRTKVTSGSGNVVRARRRCDLAQQAPSCRGCFPESLPPLQRLIICILLSGTCSSRLGGVASRCARVLAKRPIVFCLYSSLGRNPHTATRSTLQLFAPRSFAPCSRRCRIRSACSGALDASAARAATSRK